MGVPIIDAGARIVSRASSSSSLSLSVCRFLAKECELYNAVFLRLFFSFGKCFEGLIKKSARSALRYASLKEPPPRKREKKGRRRRHTTTTASSRERRSSNVVVVVVRLGREKKDMSSYFGSIGSLFQSGPKLSHDILDETTDAVARPFGPWKTFDGKSQETGEMVTIFTCKIKDKEKERGTLELARNGAKRLKLCKHPNVVQVKETLEIENGNEITIHVVTVRCLRRLFARRRLFLGGHTPPNRVTWYDVDG